MEKIDDAPAGTDKREHALAALEQLRAGQHSGEPLDLSGLDLTGVDLSDCDLSRANLQGTILFQSKMQRTQLFQANLDHAECSGSDWSEASLAGASLQHTGLGLAKLSGAVFTDANLQNATLSGANMQAANLRCANLQGARLREVNLHGADLSRADLRRVDLEKGQVDGAVFHRADMRGSCLAEVHGYERANWIGADIRDLEFTGAHLCRRFILDQNYLHEFRNRNRYSQALYYIWWLTSDCGRSALRWTLLTFGIVLLFAAFYTQVDVDFGAYPTPLSPLYFSVVTLTTLGFGDVLPKSQTAQLLTMIQVFIGYVMLGGLLSIFSSKMARRAD